jgi:hypothetical protein
MTTGSRGGPPPFLPRCACRRLGRKGRRRRRAVSERTHTSRRRPHRKGFAVVMKMAVCRCRLGANRSRGIVVVLTLLLATSFRALLFPVGARTVFLTALLLPLGARVARDARRPARSFPSTRGTRAGGRRGRSVGAPGPLCGGAGAALWGRRGSSAGTTPRRWSRRRARSPTLRAGSAVRTRSTSVQLLAVTRLSRC